jgi:hypothetical protein
MIELMFNRRGTTHDNLGMPEGMNELFNGEPIKTFHRYYLKFTSSRGELYDTIFRMTSKIMNPIQ